MQCCKPRIQYSSSLVIVFLSRSAVFLLEPGLAVVSTVPPTYPPPSFFFSWTLLDMSSFAHRHEVVVDGHLCGFFPSPSVFPSSLTLTLPFFSGAWATCSASFPLVSRRPGPQTNFSRGVDHSCAFSVILYYDYILTFTREVESFWPHRNRVGFVSSIYFLNRYVAIFGHIPMVLRLVVLESFFIVGVSLTLLTFSC